MDELRKIVAMIDEATMLMESSADWEIKYDMIFGMGIWRRIRDAGYRFDWYDPDTTYQQDVTAYYEALLEFKNRLGNLI